MAGRPRSTGTAVPASLLALSFLTAVLFSLQLLRLLLPVTRCDSVGVLHEELLSAILRSSPRGSSVVPCDAPSLSNAIFATRREVRRVGSRFRLALLNAGVPSSERIVPLSLTNEMLDKLEFGHLARYPIDGFLIYVIALLGSRTRTAIEMDAASGRSVFRGAAALAVYDGWNLLALHSRWSGFNNAQQYYDGSERGSALNWRKKRYPDSHIVISEENLSSPSNIRDAIVRHGIGGDVDLFFILLDGLELRVWRELRAISARVVVLFYQDYWGAEETAIRAWDASNGSAPVGESDGVDRGRRRLFVGGSIRALEHIAAERGYRLILCLRKAPIAIFIRADEDPSGRLLPSISTGKCLKRRESREWRRDMEGQWNSAQRFAWNRSLQQG